MTESEFIEILEENNKVKEPRRLKMLAMHFNKRYMSKVDWFNIRAMKRKRLKELGKW